MKACIRLDRLQVVGVDERTVRKALTHLGEEVARRVESSEWKPTRTRTLKATLRGGSPVHVARAIAEALLRSVS